MNFELIDYILKLLYSVIGHVTTISGHMIISLIALHLQCSTGTEATHSLILRIMSSGAGFVDWGRVSPSLDQTQVSDGEGECSGADGGHEECEGNTNNNTSISCDNQFSILVKPVEPLTTW